MAWQPPSPLMMGFERGMDAPDPWNSLAPGGQRGPQPLALALPPEMAPGDGGVVGRFLQRNVADPVGAWLAKQQQDAIDRGLWTGGEVWQGGRPTQAGMLDAARQTAEGVAMGTTSSGGRAAPMDLASRMARAREMGFDTSKTLYHATPYEFSEFVPNTWRGASYFADTPAAAQRGAAAGGMEHPALGGPTTAAEATGPRMIPVHTAGRIWGRDPLPEGWLPEKLTYGEYKAILNGENKIELPGLSKAENAEINFDRIRAARKHYDEAVPESEYHKYAGDRENDLPMKLSSPPVAEPFGYESIEGGNSPSAFAPSGSMAPADRRALLQKLGYSGWMVRDEAGNSVAVADPSKIRSTFARFDPAKASSKDITAGLAAFMAGGGAAALGGGNREQ